MAAQFRISRSLPHDFGRHDSIAQVYRLLEGSEKPADPVAFYLRLLETAASLLAEVVSGRASDSIDQWDLFLNIRICVRRIEELAGMALLDRKTLGAWGWLRNSLRPLRGWRSDPALVSQAANLVFVAASTVRQLHAFPDSVPLSGIEYGLHIACGNLPVPIAEPLGSASIEALARNFDWLYSATTTQ